MSNQNGPTWYPSRQFTHTPEVPGAPAPSATPAAARPEPARLRRTVGALVAGLASGLLVVLLLLPVSGVDTNPPVCYATFGYTVPCGSGLALGGALILGLLVGGATYRATGRRPR